MFKRWIALFTGLITFQQIRVRETKYVTQSGADPHRFPQFYGNRSDQFIIKKYIKIYKKCI